MGEGANQVHQILEALERRPDLYRGVIRHILGDLPHVFDNLSSGEGEVHGVLDLERLGDTLSDILERVGDSRGAWLAKWSLTEMEEYTVRGREVERREASYLSRMESSLTKENELVDREQRVKEMEDNLACKVKEIEGYVQAIVKRVQVTKDSRATVREVLERMGKVG